MSEVATRVSRPKALAVNLQKIPHALRAFKNFVVWKYIPERDRSRATKWKKVPFQPNGAVASHSHPATWSTFDQVAKVYECGHFHGIGFVTAGKDIPKRHRDPFVMIDIDKVREPATNAIEPWAAQIINAAVAEKAYIELSPSGMGFHIIGKGPQGFVGQKANGCEIYCSQRYFTLTGGLKFNPRQRSLGTITKTIALVLKRIGMSKLPPQPKPGAHKKPSAVPRRPYVAHWTDRDILKVAFAASNGDKLRRLLAGDISAYATAGEGASRAEMACVGLLAFWFWLDPVAIERVMRNSDLVRDKWDTMRGAETYLQRTIRLALIGKDNYYGKPCEFIAPPPRANKKAA